MMVRVGGLGPLRSGALVAAWVCRRQCEHPLTESPAMIVGRLWVEDDSRLVAHRDAHRSARPEDGSVECRARASRKWGRGKYGRNDRLRSKCAAEAARLVLIFFFFKQKTAYEI